MDTGLSTHRHRFELSGGAIAKCRVTTGSIVEHFDPFKNILPGLFPSNVAPMIHELSFQRMKEAFDHGIVPAVPTHVEDVSDTFARAVTYLHLGVFNPYCFSN